METKICVLAEYFYPDNTGGSGTILSKLLRALHDEHPDLKVDVVTSNNLFRGEAGSLAAKENWDGIQIRRLSAPQPRKVSVKRRLAANLTFTASVFTHLLKSRKKYDAIMVVTAPPTLPLAAKLYSQITGTPYIYLVYDLYLDMALNQGMVRAESRGVKVLRNIQKDWLQGATTTIVLGRCMLDHVSRVYDVARSKMAVIPIPCDTTAIAPLDKKTNFRAENNLNGFVVLYAGNFARYQDFDTLLDAAQQLKERSDITFVFVGDGAKREHIAGRIEKEELTNVRLLPFVPESALCDMLASADASLVSLERGVAGLAVPSKFYNIMASARPTIALVDAVSEVAQVINEADCGLCVAPEDSAGLRNAIEELANDAQKTERMGANARRVCEERYSLSYICDDFYNIFRDVAQKSGIEAREQTRKESGVNAKSASAAQSQLLIQSQDVEGR